MCADRQIASDWPIDFTLALGVSVPDDGIAREAVGFQFGDGELIAKVDGDHPGADGVHAVLGRRPH